MTKRTLKAGPNSVAVYLAPDEQVMQEMVWDDRHYRALGVPYYLRPSFRERLALWLTSRAISKVFFRTIGQRLYVGRKYIKLLSADVIRQLSEDSSGRGFHHGESAYIARMQDYNELIYVTAHELGHTYGRKTFIHQAVWDDQSAGYIDNITTAGIGLLQYYDQWYYEGLDEAMTEFVAQTALIPMRHGWLSPLLFKLKKKMDRVSYPFHFAILMNFVERANKLNSTNIALYLIRCYFLGDIKGFLDILGLSEEEAEALKTMDTSEKSAIEVAAKLKIDIGLD